MEEQKQIFKCANDLKATMVKSNGEVVLDEDVKSKDDTLALGIGVGDIVCPCPRTKITESGSASTSPRPSIQTEDIPMIQRLFFKMLFNKLQHHGGQQEYANYTGGSLFLTLRISGNLYNASISKVGCYDLFILDPREYRR